MAPPFFPFFFLIATLCNLGQHLSPPSTPHPGMHRRIAAPSKPLPWTRALLHVPSFPRKSLLCPLILAWIHTGVPGTSTVSMPKSWLWAIAVSIHVIDSPLYHPPNLQRYTQGLNAPPTCLHTRPQRAFIRAPNTPSRTALFCAPSWDATRRPSSLHFVTQHDVVACLPPPTCDMPMQHVVTTAPPAFEAQGNEATRHGTCIHYIIREGF